MSGEALGVDAILRRAVILHEYKVNVAVHHSSSGFRDWRYYSITPVTVPEENRDTAELLHVQMAVQAYCGSVDHRWWQNEPLRFPGIEV